MQINAKQNPVLPTQPERRDYAEGKIPCLSMPALKNGEINAGLILKDDGTPDYWLLLAEAKAEPATWQAQMDWAASLGENSEYSLPNLRELNLLRANAKSHFENDWYWSCEQHASDSDYAWYQSFGHGSQYCNDKSSKVRARAVRRLPC